MMPSRNRIKDYLPNTYYHIYNRGVEKRQIFLAPEDYGFFLQQFKRYLGKQTLTDKRGIPYKDLSKSIELLAFCLLPNHFHLLVYQYEPHALSELLQRAMTSYTMYFNRKYPRIGTLFQDRFKASAISQEPYLWHISRYIHLNSLDVGKNIAQYPYSSYPYYLGGQRASWINPQRILDMHNDYRVSYADFLSDYIDYKQTLDQIKFELADE